MKHIKQLLFGAAILCAQQAVSQGLYARLGGGYGWSFGNESIPNWYNSELDSKGKETKIASNVSLGKGLSAGLAAGYMFNEHVGAELGAAYLWGAKQTANPFFTEISFSARMAKIVPAIVLSTGGEGFSGYGRLGGILGIGSIDAIHTNHATPFKLLRYETKSTLSGGFALGMQGALGLNYQFNDKLSAYSELFFENLNYAPAKEVATSYTVEGQDKLAVMSVSEKETEFVTEMTEDGSDSDKSKPRQRMSIALPLSTIGLAVGVKMNF